MPIPELAVSRKIHNGIARDIALPLKGNVGIECRSGGASSVHQLVLTFPAPVALTSASVTTGTGSVSNFNTNGAQLTVNLTGVANAQKIVLTLFGVSDGSNTGNVSVPMGVLAGDTTGDEAVNSGDIAQTKSKSGQTVNASNFREDVNIDGSLNSGDIALVKSKSGTALP